MKTSYPSTGNTVRGGLPRTTIMQVSCITKCNIRYNTYYTSIPHMPTNMLKGFKRHSRNKRDPWDRLGTAQFNTPLYIRYGGHLQKRGLQGGSPPRPGSGTTSHTQTPTPVQAHTSQHQLLHTLTLTDTHTHHPYTPWEEMCSPHSSSGRIMSTFFRWRKYEVDKIPWLPKDVWGPEKAGLADFIFIKLLLIYNAVLVSDGQESYSIMCWASSFSRVRLFATPWTAARQAPLSMGFSRQEYWSRLPCPPPGDLPDPGTEPRSPSSHADSLRLSH